MAYSVIATPVTGTTISTTAFGILVKDNFDAAFPLGVDGWTAYVPTLVQSSSVTNTVTYAKYQRVGRLIVAQVLLACTGAGVANNAVTVGLPVTAATSAAIVVGSGVIYDQSANINYGGLAYIASTTAVRFVGTSTDVAVAQGQTGAPFAAALANLDTVTMYVTYEAAS